MTYLIAGAVVILIVALILFLRKSKQKKPVEEPGQEAVEFETAEAVEEVSDTTDEGVREEGSVSVLEEVESEAEEQQVEEELHEDEEELYEELGEPEPLVEEQTPEPVPEEAVAEEKPAAFSLAKYTAYLDILEEQIRKELAGAIQNGETVKRTLLEPKLHLVCEMQATAEGSYRKVNELVEETGNVLEQVRDTLPDFNYAAAISLLQQGEFESLEDLLGDAVSQLDEETDLAADIYWARGRIAEELLDYFGASENYRKAYAVDTDNQEYLLAAGRLARIMGNDQDAQFWLEKVVRVGIETGEKNHAQSVAQHELGLVCARTDQKEKAGALYKRAIEIKEQVLGDDHHDLGPVLHDYALLYEGNGMYEQAEKLYRRSLEVTEKEFGDTYPRLGSTLNRLAGIYEEMELAGQAEPLYIRALSIKENVLGKEHLDVGTILNHLAELMRRQGRHEEAEPLFLRSLDISEKELGPEHPNLTIVLNNLSELYSAMGREDDAARYQERAFSLFDLPSGGGDFVEMEKDEDFDIENDKDQSVT